MCPRLVSPQRPFAHRSPVAIRWSPNLGSILLCQVAGLIGLPFTDRATDSWYDRLEKPPFNPPSWVFGPVWTTLYSLIGIALWLVLRKHPTVARRRALVLFGTQLVLNAAWTPVFFWAEAPGPALVVLVGVLGWTVSDSWKLDRKAGV